MHFSKLMFLLAGSAVAVPLLKDSGAQDVTKRTVGVIGVAVKSTTPSSAPIKAAVVSSTPIIQAQVASVTPVSNAGTVSSTSVTQTTTFSAAQGTEIYNDLSSFDTATKNIITAVNNFVGGATIQTQGNAVTTTGTAWQAAAAQLLTDTQTLSKQGGLFSAADSSKIADLIYSSIAPDLVSLYTAVTNKKPIFVSVGELDHVHTTLVNVGTELKTICDNLQPLAQAADYPKLQSAGTMITNAALAVIAAYSS